MIIMSKPNAFLWKAGHLTTYEAYRMNCTIEECFILGSVSELLSDMAQYLWKSCPGVM